MPLAAQFQKLAGQAAAMRQQIFGVTAEGEQVSLVYDPDDAARVIPGYYTPIRTQQQLDELGMTQRHDTVVRFSRSVDFVPLLGKTIRITTRTGIVTVKINEYGNSEINPEWVLGCGALV